MHRKAIVSVLAFTTLFAAGCKSHEAKVADIQKEYDEVNQRFAKDCSAEMMNLPDKLSPKCADESKRLKEVTERLQSERSKQ